MTGLKILFIIIGCVEVLNLILLFFMIILEKKQAQSVIAWMTILTFLPVGGFILYMLFGSGLGIHTRRMIKRKKISDQDLLKRFDWKGTLANIQTSPELIEDKKFASFCYGKNAYPCLYNHVKIFNSGRETISSLKEDLRKAKETINVEYYIFAKDKVGKEIMDILIQKARQGVEVKLIYDSIGCKKTPRRFFRKLRKNGGRVAEFFPPFTHMRLINPKINYRNHRKIVVIDGKIAYTGGVNIRDDHMGENKKLSPWRDTHIKVEGSGVFPLQNIFLNDWRYATNDMRNEKDYIKVKYFPTPKKKGDVTIQVLQCGPDSDDQDLKDAFIKLLTNAKDRVYIQTPYFVPDETVCTAIKIAIASGVKISLMIPRKPDKKIVYLPTISYAEEMVKLGVKVYLYNGFIHSKTILVDNNKLAIGTCNIDNRSFALNFEHTVYMYSKKLNQQYAKQFEKDVKMSLLTDEQYYKKYSKWNKMVQAFYRLLSPLL